MFSMSLKKRETFLKQKKCGLRIIPYYVEVEIKLKEYKKNELFLFFVFCLSLLNFSFFSTLNAFFSFREFEYVNYAFKDGRFITRPFLSTSLHYFFVSSFNDFPLLFCFLPILSVSLCFFCSGEWRVEKKWKRKKDATTEWL